MAVPITEERKRKLDRLFEAFSLIAEGTYVFLCDMQHDYSRWSQNAVDYFGLPSQYMEDAGLIWEGYIHPEDQPTYRASIEAIFSGKDLGHDMQYRARKKSGEYVVCTCRGTVLYSGDGQPDYFVGVIRNHQIRGQIDGLTGLRNQYAFFEDLDSLIKRGTPVTVAMLGINRFTEVNEVYGYSFGNLVLQKVGRYLLQDSGVLGSVYRMDGTKFALISTYPVEPVQDHYETIRKYFREEMEVDGRVLCLDLSGGCISVSDFEVDHETVYSCLNFAYGESKLRHQGEMIVFYNELDSDNRQRLEKLQVIRASITQDCRDFFLAYQPVIDAKTEKMIGAEALLRWKNEEYGFVPPDHFIPLLERDSRFPTLGRWILLKALTDSKKMLAGNPGFTVNVNLSYAQLERPDFIRMVLDLLEETGFPAENLCLEITERCRLLDMTLLKNIIMNLRGHGVRFALDDFGTGFSAVGIVKNLPFDTIKIDRGFVSRIEEDVKERELLEHFTSLAGTFGSKVCVEGVETAGMKDILQQYRVNSFQGYYYSKPISFAELSEFQVQNGAGL